MQLESRRLILRVPTVEDVPAIVAYYQENRQHLEPWEPVRGDEFYTEEYWLDRVAVQRRDFDNNVAFPAMLFRKDRPEKVAGSITFLNFIHGIKLSCTLGYSIGASEEGQGFMTEILPVAFEYIFGELGLHRIEANYIPHNVRSGKLLRRLGFVVEGYARDYLKIAGVWQDHVLTSLTAPTA